MAGGTAGRLTSPGRHDNEWCCVICTPEATTAKFFDAEDEAIQAAGIPLDHLRSLYPPVTTTRSKP